MKIKETKLWDGYRVRNMCIKHGYYTMGTCEAYDTMLCFVDTRKPTKMNIYKVARDIVAHSNLEGYGMREIELVEAMMFDINRECVSTHYEVEE